MTDEVEIRSRLLSRLECREIHEWLIALPCFSFSPSDAADILLNLLASRHAIVELPTDMTSQIIYFKVKWG